MSPYLGKWLAGAATAAALLAAAGPAQAHGVVWSVGVGAPGAQVVVGNAPVYMAPPVYVAPRYYRSPPPVYYAPRVVVAPPPVVYMPPPAVYAPRPVFYGGPYGPPPPRFHGPRHRGGGWRR
ncbi:hypothetical protein [Pseudorhodoferax sp.]|uniref:hypothetical protein n=1 Tax=Pseudorhodoferax sp. TaxID=1993553 RepID=UPI0039E503B4